jgi:uncharacterized protein
VPRGGQVLIAAGADLDLRDDERNNPLLVRRQTGNVALLRVVLRARPEYARRRGYTEIARVREAARAR